MGAGRIFDQGAKLVQEAIDERRLTQGDTWRWLMEAATSGGTLHFLGLLSDGNVHSHIDHLFSMLEAAAEAGVSTIRVHPLLDGRDVGETSALEYVAPLEERLAGLRSRRIDARIASGGGRMGVTMDRYEADWSIVERGWNAHVLGEARFFSSATEAIETFRSEDPRIIDQYLPAFVIADDSGPVGRIEDGDAVIFFNFRGDRALEITRAFEEREGFHAFERGRVPQVRYAGMMQYDGDLELPSRFLVPPPLIDRTLGEYLAKASLRQLALSETHKFGHVTYFFNGNRSGKFDEATELYVQVPSDLGDPAKAPQMRALELTSAVLEHARAFKPHFIRVNYANGDMVGHTGSIPAAVAAMECLDAELDRLLNGLLELGVTCVITADHGNCEEMVEREKDGSLRRRGDGSYKPKTSHTLNRVPCIVLGQGAKEAYEMAPNLPQAGMANLAATVLNLLGFRAPRGYEPSILRPLKGDH
jgi:2,3-bisphosphoglycerate-independent phosphoglycerate mutase